MKFEGEEFLFCNYYTKIIVKLVLEVRRMSFFYKQAVEFESELDRQVCGWVHLIMAFDVFKNFFHQLF